MRDQTRMRALAAIAIAALTVAAAAVAVLVMSAVETADGTPQGPSVTKVWEDGSGRLGDGRTFCLSGEFCDDSH